MILLTITLVTSLPRLVFANENQTSTSSFRLEPEQCVAMRQGQQCYVDVKITWRMEDADSYCLFSSLQAKALRCWSNVKTGEFQREMSAKNNIVFSFKKQNSSKILFSKKLEMAWVYDKSTRKNISWRMF